MCSENDRKEVINSLPFEEALEKTGNGIYNIALLCTCSLILLGIGADLFGFSLVVTAACDLQLTIAQKGILTSLPFVGILLVSFFWGYIADTRGRRTTLLLSMQVGFVLSCLASLSPNWIVLAVIKFCGTCFSCAANSVSYTILGESCTQRVRNKYMLLMTSLLLFSPGFASALTYPTLLLDIKTPISLLGIVFRPWRLLCIILALPTGIGGILIYFFYESPKFLANVGRMDEALEVLRKIYRANHKGDSTGFNVPSIVPPDPTAKKLADKTLLESMWDQVVPLFRPPLLKRTVQLFYIVGVVYVTNNSFLVWLPHVMNDLKDYLDHSNVNPGNLCSILSQKAPEVGQTITALITNSTIVASDVPKCKGTVADNTLITLIACQSVYALLNFGISYLPNRRRIVLIAVLMLSSVSGLMVNLMPEPISSTVFFVLFTCTCLAMGINASYCVDYYPTSYRGMIQCLSIMVGRSSTFLGINIVGNLLFNHCTATFYFWSAFVFSSVVVAWFLPRDKVEKAETTRL